MKIKLKAKKTKLNLSDKRLTKRLIGGKTIMRTVYIEEHVKEFIKKLEKEKRTIANIRTTESWCDKCNIQMSSYGGKGMDGTSWDKFKCPKCNFIIVLKRELEEHGEYIPIQTLREEAGKELTE